MKLLWLESAERDLVRIVDGLSHENPWAANTLELHILTTVAHLEEFPEIGRQGRVAGTRELVISDYPYVVVYRIKNSELLTLTVRLTARQWPDE